MSEPPSALPPALAPRRRRAFVGLAWLLGLGVGLALAEAYVRLANPSPPVQIIRGRGLHLKDGVPVWSESTDRENRACTVQHPQRLRILLFGSSVTYGSELRAQEAFTNRLEVLLNQQSPSPGYCVLNFAQPGFQFEQKLAVARVEVARYKPALILWEIWEDWKNYKIMGQAAYRIDHFRVRPDGFIGLVGVPDALNRALMLHSRLYEYLTLFAPEAEPGPRKAEDPAGYAARRLAEVPRLAQSHGARLALYLVPTLDKPFAQSDALPPQWHTAILNYAKTWRIPAYTLQHELTNQDHQKLRMDPICHYNAAGHRALAEVMTRIVLEQLAGQP